MESRYNHGNGRNLQNRKNAKRNSKKRHRQIKQARILMVALTLIMVFMISVFFIHDKASAKDNQYKYYTSITIEYGDTLWSIADQYMDDAHYTKLSYISEVKSINHIKNDHIQEGKLLILPYYSSEYVSND